MLTIVQNEDAQWLASLPQTLGFDWDELFKTQQNSDETKGLAPTAA